MTDTTVYATDTTNTLLREAAHSTRHDDMDATTETVLRSFVVMADRAEAILRAEVIRARSMGLTWAQVGAAFGITRQAAQQRFGL